MRILHTADWHIGKKLYKRELSDDFEFFIDWLIDTIASESIDAILISGDIFDHANPSNEARTQYYRALLRLSKCDVDIVLTGGNHDSAQMLEAPKELLRNLKIHIVGELAKDLDIMHIPLGGSQARPDVIVAAIPFLRDGDLRRYSENYKESDRLEAVRNGIKRVFEESAEYCKQNFEGVPAVAMGHLYAAGVSTSESERDIQIGNLAGVESSVFGEYFDYVALGHIHKPQQVNGSIPIFYSGSPIALSFSERKDTKRVLIWDSNSQEVKSVAIPTFRVLKRISGNYAEIERLLQSDFSGNALDTLLEIELRELDYDPSVIIALDHLVQNFDQNGAEIIKHRVFFDREVRGAGELFEDVYLEDLQPTEVFDKLLEVQEINNEDRELVKSAFAEIWEEVQNQSE